MTNTKTDNIPSATQGDRRDPIERAQTPGRIAKFANAGTLTDSIITEDTGRIGVGTAPSNAILTVPSAAAASPAISARNTAPGGVGVNSDSPSGIAMLGVSQSGNGVFGKSPGGLGVAGQSTTGIGVFGISDSGVGVYGESAQADAVQGLSHSNRFAAVSGINRNTGHGVYGESNGGFAGYFGGNVHVFGTLSKGGGGFTIDHPLDPTHKTLTHSFVESPDMMNIYNGNIITDAQGDATITLPAYFHALNHEFRYQLTVMEQFAQAIVSREIQENAFTIKTDKPHVKVSWQVTGVRQDAFANAHRLAVEADKPAQEQGTYLYPVEHGQPKTKGMAQPRQLGERPPMNADVA